ncbi:hypothetical protein Ocin01_00426 [Orchesella cincta]|uniref:NECAP PHear domain-containing protein n=1 Tax=Orchesella cincta TaxID=48709 RepID=A0A1D2NLY9_ORCCI|nr:hypothetical protein Ocin01_00426 [Orchesella cincta]
MEEYESIVLVQPEVFIYKIPPRTTNRSYRANDWNLENPDWTGRLRLVHKGSRCIAKLEDKITGALFAQAPIDEYPGPAVEPVSDSSRYFVLRIQDDNGRNAFIGCGYADRSQAFDLQVTLQDHFKRVKKEQEIAQEQEAPTKPALDLGFKEGETIKINMKITKKDGSDGSSRSKSKSTTGGILPPPPGGSKLPPPPGGLGVSREPTPTSSPTHAPKPAAAAPPNPPASANTDWVQF